MNVRVSRAAAMVAVGCLLGACTAMPPTGSPADLSGTAWVLSALPGHSLVPDHAATARFDGARVQGTDGCNRYSAPYTATGSTLQVGPRGASTQMACPPAVMKQADAFMSALTGARSFRVSGGRLELLSASGTVLATFAAQAQSLAGTSWRVTGYNNGKQAVVSTLTGTDLTMVFSDDGRVTGSAGCNMYNAAYKLAGQALTIGPAAATRKMCANPQGVMEQEQQFLKALETATTARFEGDRLELRGAKDELVVALTRDSGR